MRQAFMLSGGFLFRVIPVAIVLAVLIMWVGADIAHAEVASDSATQSDTAAAADVALQLGASADANVALPADETAAEAGEAAAATTETPPAADAVSTTEIDAESPSAAASDQYSMEIPEEDTLSQTSGSALEAAADTAMPTAAPTLTGADAWFGSDHNGDGRTEVVVLYDLGNATTALYLFDPTDTGYAAPRRVWTSAPGAWEWQQSKMVVTDLNGDGSTEVTVLYDLGSHTSALYVFDPTPGGYAAPRRVWTSAPGAWEWQQSKPAVTDHNGDGLTEVSVLYDLGNATTGLYVFQPSGSGYAAPQRVWLSAPGSWNWWQSKVVATDRNGDNSTEITALYDLGNGVLGLYVFEPTAGGFAAPGRVWMSGPGGLELKHTKAAVVDNDADGSTELALLYNIGNHSACLWLFEPTAGGFAAPRKVWYSGAGAWDWLQSKLEVTDHMGDHSTEITVLYDLGNASTGLYVFEAILSGFSTPARTWISPPGSWDWRQSKTIGYHFKRRTFFSGIQYVDINLSQQVLRAMGYSVYEVALGYFIYTPRELFSTLTSTGGPGMETPTGRFRVYAKHVAIDMSGPGYYAPDVPYVLWFLGPYSIHGTYWHNQFGWPHSHGCVNLRTPAARWLFYRVPVGMMVVVHY